MAFTEANPRGESCNEQQKTQINHNSPNVMVSLLKMCTKKYITLNTQSKI